MVGGPPGQGGELCCTACCNPPHTLQPSTTAGLQTQLLTSANNKNAKASCQSSNTPILLYESFIGLNFMTNSLSLTCANFRTRSKKKRREESSNSSTWELKTGVFLSGCLNRLLTDGPIRGCCVVPAAAVSSVPQCPRQIFNPHTASSFAKIFFRIFCT